MTWKMALLSVFVFSCSSKKDDEPDPPYFTDILVGDIVSNRAVFSFSTAEPTTCEAKYGTDPENLDLTAVDPDMEEGEFSLDHSIPIEDLSPETTYYIRAVATNANEGVFESVVTEFTTSATSGSLGRENIATISSIAVSDVSSNFAGGANDSSFGINNAFDGSFTTEWATAGDGDEAYVEFSFASETTIGGFGFRSREMGDGSSRVSKVRLLFDGEEYSIIDIPDANQLYEFNFEPSIDVTQVRVEAHETTGGNTGAKEIQFYPPAD